MQLLPLQREGRRAHVHEMLILRPIKTTMYSAIPPLVFPGSPVTEFIKGFYAGGQGALL